MPATAGRVPMPSGNRLSVSDSLRTHDVWQKAVGHDPYAGQDEAAEAGSALPEVGEINSSAKGLFRLAQLTGNSSTLAPGACKKCGQVGHLFFQCRNYMSTSSKKTAEMVDEAEEDDDPPSDQLSGGSEEEDDDSSDENDESEAAASSSDSSDSDSDSSSSSSKKKNKKRKRSSKEKKKKQSKKDKKSSKKDKKSKKKRKKG